MKATTRQLRNALRYQTQKTEAAMTAMRNEQYPLEPLPANADECPQKELLHRRVRNAIRRMLNCGVNANSAGVIYLISSLPVAERQELAVLLGPDPPLPPKALPEREYGHNKEN